MNLRGFAPLCLPCLVLCAGEVREEILVVVNGHIITRRVFQQAVEQGTAALYREFSGKELDAKLRDAREKTLQGLVDSYVIADKATDLGVVASDEALHDYVDGLKKANNFTSDADFERALKGSLGIGLQAYLVRTKADMVKQEVLRREVFSRIAVEDQELKAYYEEHQADYKQTSRFRIRELVLPKGSAPRSRRIPRPSWRTSRHRSRRALPSRIWSSCTPRLRAGARAGIWAGWTRACSARTWKMPCWRSSLAR